MGLLHRTRSRRRTHASGTLADIDDYLGKNYFQDVAPQVLWIAAHSYPAIGLDDFKQAVMDSQAGAESPIEVSGMFADDTIEATQYAIWRFTDLDYDTETWPFENPDSVAAYRYLVDGATSSTLGPADVATTATLAGPTAVAPDSLAGPFTVHTSRPTATISVTGGWPVTDIDGNPIDPAAVVDDQRFYLDLRGAITSGSATVTVSAPGSPATGKIVSVPTADRETPTADSHAQTVILVAVTAATTTDALTVAWDATGGDKPDTSETTPADQSTTGGSAPRSGSTVPCTAASDPGASPTNPSLELARTGVAPHTFVLTGAAFVLLLLGAAATAIGRRGRAAHRA